MRHFPHPKALFLLLALGALIVVGGIAVRQDLVSAAWGTGSDLVARTSTGADTNSGLATNLTLTDKRAESIPTLDLSKGPAPLADLLASPTKALVAVAAKLSDGEAADALRVVLADWQSSQQIFSKQVEAVVANWADLSEAARQETLAVLAKEAHTLWQRQQDLHQDLAAAASLSGVVPAELVQAAGEAVAMVERSLQAMAGQLGISFNVTMPVPVAIAAPSTIGRYACCTGDTDCGACFDLGDAEGDGEVTVTICGTCQRYSGLGQQYDIAIVDLVVTGLNFQAVLRNQSESAGAPVDLDFFWDGRLLPEASFHHLVVAPGQKFATADLRQLTMPAALAKLGKHRLTAKLSHPKGQDINTANDSWTRVVEVASEAK